jgi:hypothetical protein
MAVAERRHGAEVARRVVRDVHLGRHRPRALCVRDERLADGVVGCERRYGGADVCAAEYGYLHPCSVLCRGRPRCHLVGPRCDAEGPATRRTGPGAGRTRSPSGHSGHVSGSDPVVRRRRASGHVLSTVFGRIRLARTRPASQADSSRQDPSEGLTPTARTRANGAGKPDAGCGEWERYASVAAPARTRGRSLRRIPAMRGQHPSGASRRNAGDRYAARPQRSRPRRPAAAFRRALGAGRIPSCRAPRGLLWRRGTPGRRACHAPRHRSLLAALVRLR